MRALRLAVALFAAIIAPQVSPLAGAASSNFSLVCGTANAGSDLSCTITRLSGGKGLFVLFKTSDATAKDGLDYTGVQQLLWFKGGQMTATVTVHTLTDQAATGTLTFNAAIAASSTDIADATAAIVEPAPAPPPAPTWVSAPITNDGYVRCKTAGGCHGLVNYPAIIANQGDVMRYAWNGCDSAAPCRVTGVFWPQANDPHLTGNKGDYYAGVEGYPDEWEGVVPG